jgi:hypothetical protein
MTDRVLFSIEAVPKPKRGLSHGPKRHYGHIEDTWQCGNGLCGACAAAFQVGVGASLCDFRAPTGERCRLTAGHRAPAFAPADVPLHVCIADDSARGLG